MRFAYVAPAVHDRFELLPGPVDTEWLLAAAAGGDDPVVFVDEETVPVQRLRDAGVPVHVSPKREVRLPDGIWIPADAVQAGLAAEAHEARPFDLIVYDSGLTTDLAWFERDLAAVPRMVALGGGFVPAGKLILADSSLFQHFGRRMWATTGFLASADALFSDAAPAEYGLVAVHLPPVYGTGTLASLGPGTDPEEPPRLMVVVATTAAAPTLGRLIDLVAARVPIDPVHTTVAVVHGDRPIGPESSRDLIRDSVPAHLEHNVILATPGRDGVAASLLETADLVVAAGPADLAIRGVADAAPGRYLLLAGEVPAIPVLDGPPPGRERARVVLVPVDGPPGDAAELLARLEADGETDAVVLHGPELAAEAFRFVDYGDLAGADLGVLARPGITYGTPDPTQPCLRIMAAARSTWPSLRRRLRRVGSIEELVIWNLGLGLADEVRLLVLPGGRSLEYSRLPIEDVPGLPAWVTPTGVLERPNLAAVSPPAPQAAGHEADMRDWAQTASWKDRTRLALPWRWGLLERAMRGRW